MPQFRREKRESIRTHRDKKNEGCWRVLKFVVWILAWGSPDPLQLDRLLSRDDKTINLVDTFFSPLPASLDFFTDMGYDVLLRVDEAPYQFVSKLRDDYRTGFLDRFFIGEKFRTLCLYCFLREKKKAFSSFIR